MKNEKEAFNYLSKYGKQNDKTWRQLADKFGFSSEDAIRKFYRIKVHTQQDDGLVLRSRWQAQKKGGEIIWLESYRAQEQDFLNKFNEFKKAFLHDIKVQAPRVDFNLDRSSSYITEISIPDFHFGKHTGLNFQQQKEYFLKSVISLYLETKTLYNSDTIILPIGNDLFNSDTFHYTTTAGTPQQDTNHWHYIFKEVWSAIINVIDYMVRDNKKVIIPVVSGNHDYTKTVMLGEVLEAYYHSNKSVIVHNSIDSPRKYIPIDNLLFAYTHGDKEKREQLPAIMAVECSEYFSICQHRFWRLGHLHKHMKDEVQGITVETMPSLVASDSWHKMMGYNSTKKAIAYIYHKMYGVKGFCQINKEELYE